MIIILMYGLTDYQIISYNISVETENLKDFNFEEHKGAYIYVFDLENNLTKGIIRLATIYWLYYLF